MPTATYTVADAKTDPVAITFKWRTLLPTDVAAATLADLGGALQSGTGSIAANASPRQAQFSVTTTPNTTVTTDRSFDVEIYDVTPSGTTLTVSKVRTKIVEDDTASTGPTIVYGPTTTKDTGSVDTGSNIHKISTTFDSTVDRLVDFIVNDDGAGNYTRMRQANDTSILFARFVGGVQQGGEEPFDGAVKPADGATISFEKRLKPGTTDVYQLFATWGAKIYIPSANTPAGNTGMKAQGKLSYTANNSGLPFTITKS